MTINQLVGYAAQAAGKRLEKRCDTTKPQGVRGRNSDNALIQEVLDWRPSISLREGIARTYPWIDNRFAKRCPQCSVGTRRLE